MVAGLFQVNPGTNVADLVELVSKTSAELEDSSKVSKPSLL